VSRRMGAGGRIRPSSRPPRAGAGAETDRPAGSIAPDVASAAQGAIPGSGRPAFVPAGDSGPADLVSVGMRISGDDSHRAVAGTSDAARYVASLDVRNHRAGANVAVDPLPDQANGILPADPGHALSRRSDTRPVGPARNGGMSRVAPDAPTAVGPHTAPEPESRHASERPTRTIPTCTAPQLLRFIKSRTYVPMHELRRRFGIEGDDDDVTLIALQSGCLFVGLPQSEGALLGDLVRGGEVGVQLSMDPRSPIVVGVFAMRPVPRP